MASHFKGGCHLPYHQPQSFSLQYTSPFMVVFTDSPLTVTKLTRQKTPMMIDEQLAAHRTRSRLTHRETLALLLVR